MFCILYFSNSPAGPWNTEFKIQVHNNDEVTSYLALSFSGTSNCTNQTL